MNRIIASTALALMLSTAAFADGHGVMKTYTMEQGAGDIHASDFIGKRIYSAERDYDALEMNATITEGAEKEWDDIGEVNDVILGRDGQVKAVILGVGGFLGLGEKDVAVPMDQIKMVMEEDADDADDYFLVVKTNKQQLTDADGYRRVTALPVSPTVGDTDEQVVTLNDETDDVVDGTERAVENTAAAAGAAVSAAGSAIVAASEDVGNAIDNGADNLAEVQADLNRKNNTMDSREAKLEATDGQARAMSEGAENQADTMAAKPVTTLTTDEPVEGENATELSNITPAKPDMDKDADIQTGANAEMAENADDTTTTTTTVVVTEAEPKTDVEVDTTKVVEAETATEPMTDENRTVLRAPIVEREGYTVTAADQLTTEDLTGARIYGSNDEDMGEIDRLLVTADGKIDRAVLDIGGFLGLGEHSIAVTMNELQILRGEGGDFRVYIDATQEELEAQPEFEG